MRLPSNRVAFVAGIGVDLVSSLSKRHCAVLHRFLFSMRTGQRIGSGRRLLGWWHIGGILVLRRKNHIGVWVQNTFHQLRESCRNLGLRSNCSTHRCGRRSLRLGEWTECNYHQRDTVNSHFKPLFESVAHSSGLFVSTCGAVELSCQP